ncbi:MAG: anhydro-N-acetylmuramic acid kinase [Cellvibrio sp.]|nr:anhydro-N-acetylmuramic acid kinase [Cellvibrio sp.]
MNDPGFYIGIMSGTSSDAIDVALISTHPKIELIASHSTPISTELRQQIHQLADPQKGSIDQLGHLDHQLGNAFANAVLELLSITHISPKLIIAIGSHGQTIRHRPSPSPHPFTIQIGDPNIIAEKTGITTVADFRRRDIAAGGQGAPLVPAFHRAVFSTEKIDRAIVNIGGMANITWLPQSELESEVIGFDTGPGNVLLDAWIYQHLQQGFDRNGAWATEGKLNKPLLDLLLSDDFFHRPPPKSTGREMFNLSWLQHRLESLNQMVAVVDVQRTLLELTAITIANSINQLSPTHKEIFVCGGGVFNPLLMGRLEYLLAPNPVFSTAKLGIDPQWIEAMAFAWLAYRRMENKPGNICNVTGAKHPQILGALYFGS